MSCRDNRRNYWKDLTTEQSLDTYSRDVGWAIATYLHGALKEHHMYKLPITPDEKEDAKCLWDTLVKGDPDQGRFHDLMRRLWEEPKLDGPDISRSTFLMHI